MDKTVIERGNEVAIMSDLRPRLAIAVLLSLLWLIVDPFLSFVVVVVVVCPSGVMIRCLRSVVEEAAIGE
jgi:hypothetical protein